MKKYSKFLLFSFIFAFALLFNISSCSAARCTQDMIESYISNNYSDYNIAAISYNGDDAYCIAFPNSVSQYYELDTFSLKYDTYQYPYYSFYGVYYDGSTWIYNQAPIFYFNNNSFVNLSTSGSTYVSNTYDGFLIGSYYSKFNVYDSGSSVLFTQTVPEALALVLKKNNPVKIFQTMTHGMILYLIVFLIGLVAFWKAWRFLSKELQRA